MIELIGIVSFAVSFFWSFMTVGDRVSLWKHALVYFLCGPIGWCFAAMGLIWIFLEWLKDVEVDLSKLKEYLQNGW